MPVILGSCNCWNLSHHRQCRNEVKWDCRECGDRLCTPCKEYHHAHSNVVRIDNAKPKS